MSIRNESTEVDANVGSLVEGLLGLLGGLLGGLLDLLNPVIGNLKLGQVIEALLTLKQKSPDLFATGSFAGRIVGDVHIENCVVSDASVTQCKRYFGRICRFYGGCGEIRCFIRNIERGCKSIIYCFKYRTGRRSG